MPKSTRSKIVNLEAQAKELRRGIRAAQLRVALDKQRGRTTPDAVVRVANRKLPEVTMLHVVPRVHMDQLSQGTVTVNGESLIVKTNQAPLSAAVTMPEEQYRASQ